MVTFNSMGLTPRLLSSLFSAGWPGQLVVQVAKQQAVLIHAYGGDVGMASPGAAP